MCIETCARQSQLKIHSAIHSVKRSFKDVTKLLNSVNLWEFIKLLTVGLDLPSVKSVRAIFLPRKAFKLIHKVFMKRRNHILVLSIKEFLFKLWDLNLYSNVHSEEKPYSYKICKTFLWSSASLTIHIWEIIVEKKLFIVRCVVKISTKAVIWFHIIRHI